MKKITNKIIACALVAAGVLLQGCAGAMPGASDMTNTRELAEIQMLYSGVMFRGMVVGEQPHDLFDEMLDNYPYSDEQFYAGWGVNKEDAYDMIQTFVAFEMGPGIYRDFMMLAPRHLKLKHGDIIDVRGFRTVVTQDKLRNKVTIQGIAALLFRSYIDEAESIDMSDGEGAVVLGVVCRADEDGCDYNESPGTMIGIGRRLESVADYRGVEAESTQEMRGLDTNMREVIGWDWTCNACDDDAAAVQEVSVQVQDGATAAQ